MDDKKIVDEGGFVMGDIVDKTIEAMDEIERLRKTSYYQLEESIREKDATIMDLGNRLREAEAHYSNLNSECRAKDAEIARLRMAIDHNGTPYHVVEALRKENAKLKDERRFEAACAAMSGWRANGYRLD
jgi:predicted RNase H-like nuclease (RuvC/YqgF family)